MISITLVGGYFEEVFESILADLGINLINPINVGMFGNFKILTYLLDIPDTETIETRKTVLTKVKERMPFAQCMCEYGNWNHIVILFPRKKQGI